MKLRNPDRMSVRTLRRHLQEYHASVTIPSRASNEAWSGEDLDVIHQDAHRDQAWDEINIEHTHAVDANATSRYAYKEPRA